MSICANNFEIYQYTGYSHNIVGDAFTNLFTESLVLAQRACARESESEGCEGLVCCAGTFIMCVDVVCTKLKRVRRE